MAFLYHQENCYNKYLNIIMIIIVGVMAQISVLSLKPYLVIWIRPRRSKRTNRPQNEGLHMRKVEEYSPRRLSLSDMGNVGRAST